MDAVTKVEWNFAEVVDAAERLAAVLQTRYALVKGQVVALALPNSGEFVVSLLAVSMCGAVTTLVNPVYTTGRYPDCPPECVRTSGHKPRCSVHKIQVNWITSLGRPDQLCGSAWLNCWKE